MKFRLLALLLPCVVVPITLMGQGRALDPADLAKPLGES